MIELKGFTEQEAYKYIQDISMNKCKPIQHVAKYNASELKNRLGKDFAKLPIGAIGVYTYFERLAQGLRQMMCGARKFGLEFITRDDIFALTKEAAEITGIKYVMDHDAQEAARIIG